MPPTTGRTMELARNTGTVAVPVWTAVTEVEDVSISSLSLATADLRRRASLWTKKLAGVFEGLEITFKLIHGLDSTTFDAIRTAFLAQTVEEWGIFNGTAAGSEGLRVPVLIAAFPWDQPLVDVSGHDVTLSLAYMEEPAGTEIDLVWYTKV